MAIGSDKKFLLVGAGAIGSIYGWRLKQGGSSVSVVCRSNYEVVKKAGFQIDSTFYGAGSFIPDAVYSSCKQAADQSHEEFDYVLVCTKNLPNISNPANTIKDVVVSEKVTIVLIQNGIDIEKYYKQLFPNNRVITSIAHIFAKQVETGVITNVGQASLIFNVFKGTNDSEFTQQDVEICDSFRECLLAGNVLATISDNIQRERWVKIVWNISISPVSVLTSASNTREMLDCPETRALLIASMHEAIKVGEAVLNTTLTTDIPSDQLPLQIIDKVDSLPKPFYPSMMIDMQNSRPMEHQVIVKNVIDYANKFNINVPILQTMYSLMILMEKKYLS
ncbi:hypothetical protein AYI70_g6142 [Smittium culicis]|uniref:2-dehydropantoate 2-reductase n=1 Tax=Smittium culicis TaxID=133412 RepID=A0A1R1XRA3_9FUNG|nr:hypothetical protein AYI70_g6142 [Smittium culicis]